MSKFFDRIGMLFLRLFRPKAARRRLLRESIPVDLGEFFECENYSVSKLASDADSHYSVFYLWKDQAHKKRRQIEAPDIRLKKMQHMILRKMLYAFAPSPYSHGFVRKRSIVSNAALHTGRKFVLKLDLKDFFPSVTREMILREWRSNKLITPQNEQAVQTILRLCMYKDRLPQGAPTSPALANIVCRKLDYTLAEFARKRSMTYSRYADDLTFSGNSDECYKLIPLIKELVAACGFTVNEKKVNVLKPHRRQTVTGLVVNCAGRVGVKRHERMKLRAYMHQIIKGKIPRRQVNMQKLRGHVSFLQHADPRHGAYFAKQLKIIEKMS